MMLVQVMNALALIVVPFVLTGIIVRTKSLWSGRKGPPVLQPAYDVLRLLRKSSVYSTTTTSLFRIAPWVFLLTSLSSAMVTPLLGTEALVSFPFDFIWLAYAWALGRVAIMLAGLDTGSAFEGMGVAREATFSALLEPALFVVAGTFSLSSGSRSLSEMLVLQASARDGSSLVWLCGVTTLFVVLQVETARMPVDDPTTHLELTMVHEVMVLDHSGPDLAAIQYGSAVKLYVGISFLATLLNPWAGTPGLLPMVTHLTACVLVAVAVGTVESLIARLRLRTVPTYIMVGLLSATVALLASTWRTAGSP